MPRPILKIAAGLALLAVATVSDARADGTRAFDLCGGSSFRTCAAVTMTASGNWLTIGLKNNSGLFGTDGSTVFTAIGLNNLPPGVFAEYRAGSPSNGQRVASVTGPVRAINRDGVANWAVKNNVSTGGATYDVYMSTGAGAYGGREFGIASNCDPGSLPAPLADGQPGNSLDIYMTNSCDANASALDDPTLNDGWVNVKFRLSDALTQEELDALVVTIKGVNSQGAETFVATPEPITMLLLGTGLAGMGGAGLIRRQRSNGEVADG